MFTVTVTSSIATGVLSILVLAALRINRDNSLPTRRIKTALLINLFGLIMVLVTFSMCRYAEQVTHSVDSTFYRTCFTLRDFSDFFVIPVSIAAAEYIRAVADNNPRVDRHIDRYRKFAMVLAVLLVIDVGGYDVGVLMGFATPTWNHPVYDLEAVLGLLCFAGLTVVVFSTLKYLSREKRICFLIYLASQLGSIAWMRFSDESLFFSVNAALLVFLFLAMQTEQIDMSKVETVRKALKDAELLNEQLETSLAELGREQQLLKEISGIYNSLHVIDLEHDTFREIGAVPDKVHNIMHGPNAGPNNQQIMWGIMRRVTNPAFTDNILKFTDFSTLNTRLSGRRVVTFEALNDENRWFRFLFIRVGDDVNAKLTEVIFASQNIDRETREKERLKRVSYIDEMTGVFNRNAYMARLTHFREAGVPADLWIALLDVNDLKHTNDSLGHEAGDELICAAATCLTCAFGEEGQIYRSGGDEFVVMAQADRQTFDSYLRALEDNRASWHGSYSENLFFSLGCVCAGDHPDLGIEAIIHEADKRMYENKKAFYAARPELDRRRRS